MWIIIYELFYKLLFSILEILIILSMILDRDLLEKEYLMLIWMLMLLVYVIVVILFGGIYLYWKIKGSVLFL